jgi:RimJ/RimL family protein N-acetyltransferase
MNNINLRHATIDDCKLIYSWANDSEVRENSFQSDKIVFENHVKWFNEKINSNSSEIYILIVDNNDVGQIRLDCNNDSATISYCIDKNFRGKGYGSLIIQLIEHKAKEKGIKYLYGYVKKQNISSQIIFDKNLYKKLGTKEEHITYLKNI